MAVDDFPSNSKYSRPREESQPAIEAKRVDRVVQGEIVRRKKPMSSRIKETFVGDGTTSVGEYVLLDVVVPAVKDLIHDAFIEGMQRVLFPDGGRPAGRRVGGRGGGNGRTNYNAYSRDPRERSRNDDRDRDRPRMSQRARANHDFDEIILPTRVEANEVVDRLLDLLEKYDAVTIADLYHMVGVTPDYTDEKYGWTDLRGTSISHTRQGGYLLNLPRPEQLER